MHMVSQSEKRTASLQRNQNTKVRGVNSTLIGASKGELSWEQGKKRM